MKQDLQELNEKYNYLERVLDNKMDFIESNLSKLLEKEGNQKEIKKDENKSNKSKKNENNINNNEANKINLINNYIDQDYFKEFEQELDIIFSKENEKSEDIDEENISKLKKITLNIMQNHKVPSQEITDYFRKKFEKRTPDENFEKLVNKKVKILEILGELDILNRDKLYGIFKDKGNDGKNVDLKNFDIDKFRKEFNLSEKEYSDDIINRQYLECKGNEQKMFCKLIGL